jgi:hypothetical protein
MKARILAMTFLGVSMALVGVMARMQADFAHEIDEDAQRVEKAINEAYILGVERGLLIARSDPGERPCLSSLTLTPPSLPRRGHISITTARWMGTGKDGE